MHINLSCLPVLHKKNKRGSRRTVGSESSHCVAVSFYIIIYKASILFRSKESKGLTKIGQNPTLESVRCGFLCEF